MSTITPPQVPDHARVKELVDRGNAGDQTVLPQLRDLFDRNPEFAAEIGSLVKHAEQSLLLLAAGKSLTLKEAISRQIAELRERLVKTARSELERLLVDRIVLCWMQVYYCDVELTDHVRKGLGPNASTQASQKRLDRAHLRYLGAIKALATVQKLIRPSLPSDGAPLRLVPEPSAGRRREDAASAG
jgi:hypothetical protein